MSDKPTVHKCPQCKGSGQVPDPQHATLFEKRKITCGGCHGTGEVVR